MFNKYVLRIQDENNPTEILSPKNRFPLTLARFLHTCVALFMFASRLEYRSHGNRLGNNVNNVEWGYGPVLYTMSVSVGGKCALRYSTQEMAVVLCHSLCPIVDTFYSFYYCLILIWTMAVDSNRLALESPNTIYIRELLCRWRAF